jgi:hypothetical protein
MALRYHEYMVIRADLVPRALKYPVAAVSVNNIKKLSKWH